MHGHQLRDHFLQIVDTWVCDGYAIDTRYLALNTQYGWRIAEAAITLWPLPNSDDTGFTVQTDSIVAGRTHIRTTDKTQAIAAVHQAADGQIESIIGLLSLDAPDAFEWYCEAPNASTWFSPLQLRVSARNSDPPVHLQTLAQWNDDLRRHETPFDGLPDLCAQLGLRGDLSGSTASKIQIAVSPPVDLLINGCVLEDNKFNATVLAHPNFDLELVRLAIRAVPGNGIRSRSQVAKEIQWEEQSETLRKGTLSREVDAADSVLTMLSIASRTVRRQWILDMKKAQNPRYLALQTFDPEFRMLRRHIFETQDSKKFEHGVSALLYMLGFSVGLPAESDAPDITATLPSGESLLVECTIKTSDFASKVGKLVERRAALAKAMATANLPSAVTGVLVCRLPRDQISATDKDLANHDVLLYTFEDLEAAFMRIRYVQDTSALLRDARGAMNVEGIGE